MAAVPRAEQKGLSVDELDELESCLEKLRFGDASPPEDVVEHQYMMSGALQGDTVIKEEEERSLREKNIFVKDEDRSLREKNMFVKDTDLVSKAEPEAEEYHSCPALVAGEGEARRRSGYYFYSEADLAQGQKLGLSAEEIYHRRARSHEYQMYDAVAVVYLCAAKGEDEGGVHVKTGRGEVQSASGQNWDGEDLLDLMT